MSTPHDYFAWLNRHRVEQVREFTPPTSAQIKAMVLGEWKVGRCVDSRCTVTIQHPAHKP